MSLSVDDLIDYFRQGAKPRADFRLGMEQEKLSVLAGGGPVPYGTPGGTAELLRRLEGRGYVATREDGHVIGLERKGERITLEPGGQLELSGAARPSARQCFSAIVGHTSEVVQLGREMGIELIGVGARPFGTLEDVEWLPKRRYAVMRSYFPNHGRSSRLAHHMMKMTATVQANLDFTGEEEAVRKIRAGYGVTSIVTAMFAASPILEGRPSGFKSFRAAVWLETDENRCGLLPFVFEPSFSFRDYVEWALDVPMFFVVRAGEYLPVADLSFRRFMAEGHAGHQATLGDWAIHLSTVFPEVRLKRTIELRGADAGPLSLAGALGALWRGLLDDPEACDAAWALVAGATLAERETLRREVPRAGLESRFLGRPLRDLAVELIQIAGAGLRRLPAGAGDVPLLDPILAYASAGRSPADDLLADFHAANGDPTTLVRKWALLP